MELGYIGLSISYLFLISIVLIIFIKARVSTSLKLILIPIVIWYGLVLYSVPSNFMGWAKEQSPPDKTIILNVWIEEPSSKTEGGIYFWGLKYPTIEELVKFSVDPKQFVQYLSTSSPRSYKIPYDEEFHKKWLEAQKQQKEKGGIMLYHRGMKPGNDKGKSGQEQRDDSGFKLVNPSELLPKVEPAPTT